MRRGQERRGSKMEGREKGKEGGRKRGKKGGRKRNGRGREKSGENFSSTQRGFDSK